MINENTPASASTKSASASKAARRRRPVDPQLLVDERADAQASIAAALAVLRRTRQRHRRELTGAQAKLDRLVAEATSSAPTDERWWAYPGLLSIEETLTALEARSPAELDRSMCRHRAPKPGQRPARA